MTRVKIYSKLDHSESYRVWKNMLEQQQWLSKIFISAAASLLRLWVQIPPGGMLICLFGVLCVVR